MVTLNPKRTFTSLKYRKRLHTSTSTKEAELIAYVQDQGGEAIIDGFRVTLQDGKLTWVKLPQSATRQLAFPFIVTEGG